MSTPFDPAQGLVIITALISGPAARAFVRLALDTGATSTLVNSALLVYLGYNPAVAPDRVRVTTGSGVEYAASPDGGQSKRAEA